MKIRHIMKDGSIKHDIGGHVVKIKEVKGVYTLMDNMRRKKGFN